MENFLVNYRLRASNTVWSTLIGTYWQTHIHENIVNMREAPEKQSPSYLTRVKGRDWGVHTLLHLLPGHVKVHKVVERDQRPGVKNCTNEYVGIPYLGFNIQNKYSIIWCAREINNRLKWKIHVGDIIDFKNVWYHNVPIS